MEDNIAIIDYEKCTSCGACTGKCPTKCIKVFN
jgi:electron transport complex protein RnfB